MADGPTAESIRAGSIRPSGPSEPEPSEPQRTGPETSTAAPVLIAGFAVLAMSDFLVNEVMGVMMALTIFCALVADFLVLPPLLIALDKRKEPKHAPGASREPTAHAAE